MTTEEPHKYGYSFNVTPVKRCPMNKTEHEKAEARMGCNTNHSYHCTPDKYHHSLIEFCLPKKQNLVQAGNCLELINEGYLEQVKCQNFTFGCPETYYRSNELYKYPACLSLALSCFTSDTSCLQERFTTRPKERGFDEDIPVWSYVFFGLFWLALLVILVMVVKWRKTIFCGKKNKTLTTSAEDANETIPLNIRNQAEEISVNVGNRTEEISGRDPHQKRCTLDPEELECEHMLEDMELLVLLRRHCLNGAFENFKYLLETRILNKADKKLMKILEASDRDGRSLLHYAAKGGSVDILKALLKHCTERKVEDKDDLGHTLLHLACKYDKYDICVFLLSEENHRKREMKEKSNHSWRAAHFAASCGNMRIFKLLLDKRFDVNSATRNELNILDIACINNKTDFCKELIKMHGELTLSLEKTDGRDWNIAHIAARVGNKDLLEILINGYIQVAKSKTHHKKTILHICCEHGHYEVCKFIVENEQFKDILNDIDERRWNALHFCAKGGNMDAFKLIESKNILDDETEDGKTVLHICCIHQHVEICKYVCDKLMSEPQKINQLKTKKNLWTPAHYVAVEIRQDGTEEELIRILVEAGIDLKAKSIEGNTVLVEACKHRNKNLVLYFVKHHPELLAVEPDKVKHAARDDPEILQIINNAYVS